MPLVIGAFRAKKSLGQSFLISSSVAEAEAEHAVEKNVLELGPGQGMLTRELCKRAKRVVAVELDRSLYIMLKHGLRSDNLVLINKDFFKATDEELMLKDTDIMIANIPYKLSSSVIEFLGRNRLQAVLCLQKEFVEHMMAETGSDKYSRLSVMSQLQFRMYVIMKVPRKSFRPVPRVDSCVIYLKPLPELVTDRESDVINALMQHKKKTVRNAILDADRNLGMGREELAKTAERLGKDQRKLFKLSPDELLGLAREIIRTSSAAPAPA